MRKYELSISADYVPEWGITEAVREYFQNSIDEETSDNGNKMFFDYDRENQIIRIGNKHSDRDIGIDFKQKVVRLERDRSMVNSFDVKWYAARMIEETKDAETIKNSLNSYSGTFIESYRVPPELRDEVAEEFINQYGAKAVPVSNQEDIEGMKKRGYKAVIVSEAKKKIILEREEE